MARSQSPSSRGFGLPVGAYVYVTKRGVTDRWRLARGIRSFALPQPGLRSGAQARFCKVQGYAPGMAHYLFNFVRGDEAKGPALRERAAGFLRVRMWGIDADEPHRSALALGDLILIYLAAPERKFIGRAELASAVHD